MNGLDSYNPLQPRNIFGRSEGAQSSAAYAAPALSGGFSFTPGGVSINGDQITSSGGLQFDIPLATVQSFTNRALEFTSNNASLNRGFVGGVIQSGQSNLTASQNAVLDFGRTLQSTNVQLVNRVTDTQKYIAKANKGCFITTAVCKKDGLPDDCEMLETFRTFRDTHVIAKYPSAVREYYATAPGILERIEKRDGEELELLKMHFLVPAFNAIKSGDIDRAMTLYFAMVIVARGMAE